MITIHPVCGLIPSTKSKRNRKKGEKSVARTQVYSHGQVRVLECLSELRRKPSRAQSGPTTPVGAYHAIECIGFPARVPCLHGSSHARHVGTSYLPAACMSTTTTCRTHRPAASYEPTRWMWAEPALTSSLCSCAPPLLGRLVCLMLISSHVGKQISF